MKGQGFDFSYRGGGLLNVTLTQIPCEEYNLSYNSNIIFTAGVPILPTKEPVLYKMQRFVEYHLKGQCHEKCLISVEHRSKIDRQSVFSSSIICLVLQISLFQNMQIACDVISRAYQIQVIFCQARNIIQTNQQNLFKLYTSIVL